MFMDRGIFFEVGEGELKQRDGGLWPAFLHVNKGAGQLDQTLVKGAIRAVFVLKPQMLQHFMGLVKQLAVETLEITEVMRVEFLPVMIGDHLGNAFAFAAHGVRVKSKVQSLKPKIAQILRSPQS